ncbi:N-acetyltransferase GCN5 [Natrialba chahannaoensis JCM 10990]|uniref:N-acetyltransferase GCN5 n=1 Tax=Natrialba chahannaoensis JCM 10990 TaxID=1227492 RepID=M0AGE6_9EURY|nr:GNAT family protein [Natrialba chahannaoensis]ELY97614.1 N-acetyltransferase GCN5 [Natrialba chahannaoensis JCM 10990]
MSLFPTEMESERLRYERLHPGEFNAYELYEHVRTGAPHIDELTKYMTWDPHAHPKESFDWVEQAGEKFDDGEAANYLVRPTEGERAGELAGTAGLFADWDRRRAVFGTWFRKPFWGRGYSGERAARMLELAFDRLDLELVAVSHDPGNEKSRRAIEKYVDRFGGRKEGRLRNEIVIDDEPRDAVQYSISRDEWERNCE